MLERFKLFLQEDVEDNIANAYLSRATNTVLKLTNRTLDELEDDLEDLIVDLAIYRYQRRNSIVYNSESYSGATFNYNNSIPDFLLKEIKSYRKLKVL